METIVIPKYEYLSMKQQIAELQRKVNLLQDVTFMNKLKFFVDFFYKDNVKTNINSSLEPLPFKFGVARGLIDISDDFNAPLDEFNDYI
jgi:hypothetical protein